MEYFSRRLLRHLFVCCRHSVTWPDSLRWVFVELLGPGLAQLPGFQPGREVPDDHCYPSTTLATIQPAFTASERLALATYIVAAYVARAAR